jgi:hypothetical protein
MIPIVASLLGTLAQNGLGLLSSAIQAKGKEVVENTLGVKIPDNPTPEDVSKLRQLQFEMSLPFSLGYFMMSAYDNANEVTLLGN